MKDIGKLYADFLARWKRIAMLDDIASVLDWDMEVMMPKGASIIRGEQRAALDELVHELSVDDGLWSMITELKDALQYPVLGVIARANIQNAYTQVKAERKLPLSLVSAMAKQEVAGLVAWEEAHAKGDFHLLAPSLEKTVALAREYAQTLAENNQSLYSVHLEDYEEDMSEETVECMLSSLANQLVPFTDQLFQSQPLADRSFVKYPYEPEMLHRVARHIVRIMGFDMRCGRLDHDPNLHPMTIGSMDDVRLTTRYTEEEGLEALWSAIHEAGHGLYEQGLPREHRATPIGIAASMSAHESQSRFWEICIGLSAPFLGYLSRVLAPRFPAYGLGAETLFHGLNQVVRTPIRLQADPLTYNLHIVLRFQLEQLLINGDLSVLDLPSAWGDLSEKLLGCKPACDAEGPIQDVHWACGMFGYFPTYALGNLIAAQLFERMEAECPTWAVDVSSGRFRKIRRWLFEKVHQHGAIYGTPELVTVATSQPLASDAFLRLAHRRYRASYGLGL